MKEKLANLILFTLIVIIVIGVLSYVGIIKLSPKYAKVDEFDPIAKIKANYDINPIKIPYDSCIMKGFSIKKCEPFIYTINPELSTQIDLDLQPVIKRRNDRGMNLSITKVQVLNLAGRFQVGIEINCTQMSYKDDELVIKNIAKKLAQRYPLDFSKNSHRSSFADVTGCSVVGVEADTKSLIREPEYHYTKTIWRIQKGTFYSLI